MSPADPIVANVRNASVRCIEDEDVVSSPRRQADKPRHLEECKLAVIVGTLLIEAGCGASVGTLRDSVASLATMARLRASEESTPEIASSRYEPETPD